MNMQGDLARALDALRECLLGYRFRYANEVQLHYGIDAAFSAHGFDYCPEVSLGDAGRIDYLVDGVGVEVKVAGSTETVARQLDRYAARPEVEALLLVSTRARHMHMPTRIREKPVRVAVLTGSAW